MQAVVTGVPRILRGGAAALLGLLALGAASCQQKAETDGSTAPDTAAPAGMARVVDVCTLVPKEAVAAAIAQPIANVAPGQDSCKYETDDAMASSVEIVVKRQGAAEEMDTARKATGILSDMGAGMASSEGAKGDVGGMLQNSGAVSGVGEQAFFDSTQTLHVLNKGTYVAVTPPMMKSRMSAGNPLLSTEERRAMATAIAQKVLAST